MSEFDSPKQDPNTVLSHVQKVIDEHQHLTDDFNWLGLAETADSNARVESNTIETSLAWAKIAVLVYSYLGAGLTKADRASFERSAMVLRIFCIKKFGPRQDEELLDPQAVLDWFLGTAEMSPEEAQERAKRQNTLPADQWLELRLIKNRLRVVKLLYESQVPAKSVIIEKWLAMEPDLP